MYLAKYILLSIITFVISFFGIIFNRKSIIIVLISIELLLLAVNLLFIVFSVYLDSIDGFIFYIVSNSSFSVNTVGCSLSIISYIVPIFTPLYFFDMKSPVIGSISTNLRISEGISPSSSNASRSSFVNSLSILL